MCSYVIGADPSQGIGRDRAAGYVVNQANGHLAARIWGQLSPEEFAAELHKLAQYYNKAWICPERNNHGHVVLHALRERLYPHIYRTRGLNALTGEETEDYGYVTTSQSKLVLTEHFKTALKTGDIRITDSELIDELTTFIQVAGKGGSTVKREAAPGKHDDLVIAAALAWEMHLARPAVFSSNEALVATPEGYAVGYDPVTGAPDYN